MARAGERANEHLAERARAAIEVPGGGEMGDALPAAAAGPGAVRECESAAESEGGPAQVAGPANAVATAHRRLGKLFSRRTARRTSTKK
eukprot:2054148-Alexandrium_andersonii.AAC.1